MYYLFQWVGEKQHEFQVNSMQLLYYQVLQNYQRKVNATKHVNTLMHEKLFKYSCIIDLNDYKYRNYDDSDNLFTAL